MRDLPNDDKTGIVAEKPEHCYACYRLIRPGRTYYLTIDGIVHCEDCALSEGVIRVTKGEERQRDSLVRLLIKNLFLPRRESAARL